eukprot:UN00712
MSRIFVLSTQSSTNSIPYGNAKRKEQMSGNVAILENVLQNYSTLNIEDNQISERELARYAKRKIRANCECGDILMRGILNNKPAVCDGCNSIVQLGAVIFACDENDKLDKTTKHEYKICEQCAVNKLINDFRNQTVYDADDEIKPKHGSQCGVSCVIQ